MPGISQGDLDLVHGQKRILEMVAKGAPLVETLGALIGFVEAQGPDLRCGILIVAEDRRHFRRGSGPRLPEAYHAALDGVSITPPFFGAYSEAAHCGRPIVVPEIANDTNYAPVWRDLLAACGLTAMRSGPV